MHVQGEMQGKVSRRASAEQEEEMGMGMGIGMRKEMGKHQRSFVFPLALYRL